MSRVDITIGLLAILATVAVTALVGFGEEARMERDSVGWDARKIEVGAELFEQYCASCHGVNAVGGLCPPLDETSGLHGGELGPGVAWRLEELGWDPQAPFEYVHTVISAGRTISTRPDRYAGNRVSSPADGAGADAASMPEMAMPAHGQTYGGPLRPDQIEALAHYIVSFSDAVPENPEEALEAADGNRAELASVLPEPPVVEPTATATAIAEEGETTDAAAGAGVAGTAETGTETAEPGATQEAGAEPATVVPGATAPATPTP